MLKSPYDPNQFSNLRLAQNLNMGGGQVGVTNEILQQLCPTIGYVPQGQGPRTGPPPPSEGGRTQQNFVADRASRDDSKVRSFGEGNAYAIQKTTSNLNSCPAGQGEVPMAAWFLASDQLLGARMHPWFTGTPAAQAEPRDIMQPSSTIVDGEAAAGQYPTINDALYYQTVLPSELRVYTGTMVNTGTGEMMDTFEEDLPPPNQSKDVLQPNQLSFQNPRMFYLDGGVNDPNLPERRKMEVAEDQYGADAGPNIWGPQLYTDRMRQEITERFARTTFNNHNGILPIEPAWDKHPVGFVGYVQAYRNTPYVPATQRNVNGDTFDGTLKGLDYQYTPGEGPPNMTLGAAMDKSFARGLLASQPDPTQGNERFGGMTSGSSESISGTHIRPGAPTADELANISLAISLPSEQRTSQPTWVPNQVLPRLHGEQSQFFDKTNSYQQSGLAGNLGVVQERFSEFAEYQLRPEELGGRGGGAWQGQMDGVQPTIATMSTFGEHIIIPDKTTMTPMSDGGFAQWFGSGLANNLQDFSGRHGEVLQGRDVESTYWQGSVQGSGTNNDSVGMPRGGVVQESSRMDSFVPFSSFHPVTAY